MNGSRPSLVIMDEISEAVAEERARNIVRIRANGRCEAAVPNVCMGKHDTTHHRRKRR